MPFRNRQPPTLEQPAYGFSVSRLPARVPLFSRPAPLVDLATATRAAKARLHALRAQAPVRAAKAAIVEKHGSRLARRTTARRPAAPASRQQSLDF